MRGMQDSCESLAVVAERGNLDAVPSLEFSVISSPRVAGELRRSGLAEDVVGHKILILNEIEMPWKFAGSVTSVLLTNLPLTGCPRTWFFLTMS